jgi:hypothetical protein
MMPRNVIAVLAGGLTGAALYQLGAVIALVVLYGIPLGSSPEPPGVPYYILNLSFAALAAGAAGLVTARLARPDPRAAIALVAVILAGVSLWGFTRPASQWPAWYAPVLAMIALTAVGIAGYRAGKR